MAIMSLWVVFLIWCAAFRSYDCGPPEILVNLKQGAVKGHISYSDKGYSFLRFEGIPYAKPPVGDLRFADPQPAGKWEGVLEGNDLYTCAQLIPFPLVWGPSGTEDCLYVYVYVPGESIRKDANLPVVVHIHGGAFMIGAPEWSALPEFIMNTNVVYITMNYRLGVLGFLSTENTVVPGNMGLKDQSMALKWIKDNVKEFGGNPNSITLTGSSAGGASVHYHYLSPMSRGLFARGLSQSGTALQSWALTEKPLKKAKFVASNIGCGTENTKKMIQCMRTKSHTVLILGITGLFVLGDDIPLTPFGPVVERWGYNRFISDNPYKLLKEGKVFDVPWINTNVKNEGVLPVFCLLLNDNIEELVDNWDTLMPASMDMNDTVDDSLKAEVARKIKKFYFKDEEVSDQDTTSLENAYGDRFFFVDSELATRTHAKAVKSPVYVYFFKFSADVPFILNNLVWGAYHGYDGKLIFKWSEFGELSGDEEEDQMMHLMTEFIEKYAATGVPQIGGVKWNPVKPGKKKIDYLEINGPNDIRMKSTKAFGATEFWNSLPLKENNHIF